jgi:hypothetical protein
MLPMSVPALNRSLRFLFRATAAALLAAFLGLAPAAAQVVALVNGAPVTELDIQQRIMIIQLTSHKSASRQ